MQDLKNNSEQTNRDDGRQNESESHPFDRQVSRRLEEAEVTPPMDLMDKIFGVLEEQEPKEQATPAAPVKPVRSFRWRIPNVAAIAGILIVLAIGVRELIHQDAGVVEPGGQPAVQSPLTPGSPASKDTKIAQKGANTAKVDMMDDETEAETKKVASTATVSTRHNANASPDKRSESRPAAAVKPAVKAHKTALAAVSAKDQPVQADRKQRGDDNNSIAVTGIAVKKSSPDQALTAQIKRQRTIEIASVVDQQKDIKKTTMSAAVAGNKNEAAKTVVLGDMSPQNDNNYALAGTDEVNKRDRADRSERRGLLKGIFKKIGNTARAITDDVVSHDEDKTVINVGVLAITAYK